MDQRTEPSFLSVFMALAFTGFVLGAGGYMALLAIEEHLHKKDAQSLIGEHMPCVESYLGPKASVLACAITKA
jgi:hypothetical protein